MPFAGLLLLILVRSSDEGHLIVWLLDIHTTVLRGVVGGAALSTTCGAGLTGVRCIKATVYRPWEHKRHVLSDRRSSPFQVHFSLLYFEIKRILENIPQQGPVSCTRVCPSCSMADPWLQSQVSPARLLLFPCFFLSYVPLSQPFHGCPGHRWLWGGKGKVEVPLTCVDRSLSAVIF